MRALLLGFIATLAWANPSLALQCFNVDIEVGKSYEFSVNPFGVVTPLSVSDRGVKAVYVLHKTYVERDEIGATGTFDTCEMAEAFVDSAAAEIDAMVTGVTKMILKPLESLGELPGLENLPNEDSAGTADEIIGSLTLRGGFYSKSCRRLPDGGMDCVESDDRETYQKLKAEQRRRALGHLADDMCAIQEEMGDNPSKPGYAERTAICGGSKQTPAP